MTDRISLADRSASLPEAASGQFVSDAGACMTRSVIAVDGSHPVSSL